MMLRASKSNTLKDADEGNVFLGIKNMTGTSCFWFRQFVSKPFQTVIEERSIHGATQFLKPQRIFVWLLTMQHLRFGHVYIPNRINLLRIHRFVMPSSPS